jgi:hypothetical protein
LSLTFLIKMEKAKMSINEVRWHSPNTKMRNAREQDGIIGRYSTGPWPSN